MRGAESAARVYVCHTFYHAYIACVKELLLRREDAGRSGADLILSTMSNDFGELPERLRSRGLFRGVLLFDEQRGDDDAKLQALHRNRGNLLLNLFQRVRYTRRLGRLQEPHVPVDFRAYGDVFVFCDSDPIGYYLNEKKVRYHALEDGLNCDKLDDMARLSNEGAFRLKALLAKTGLIFIPNGYSRYCVDYEVNDRRVNPGFPENVIEVPRRSLTDRLSTEDHALLADVFLPDAPGLRRLTEKRMRPTVMILTEPLCAPDVRERLFGDIVKRYVSGYDVIIKPHPRDLLDYEGHFAKKYPGLSVLAGRFPLEALDDLDGFRVAKLVSVITQVDDVRFADEVVYLGLDFLDRYEEPAVHRKMERLRVDGGEKKGAAFSVRPAEDGDRDWWLAVRDDETARKNSTDTAEIAPEVHARWFAEKLADGNERLYVFSEGAERVGHLRLSRHVRDDGGEDVEISYTVAPEARGRGVGRAVLEEAKRLSAEGFPDGTLFGLIKEGNAVSLHLFQSCGFSEEFRGDGKVRYVWKA